MARRNPAGVRLITRKGNDFTARFPQIVAAVAALPVRSCLIDGEAIVSDEDGLAVFELLRSWRHDHAAVFCAFDLIEQDGEDLRRLPIEVRKAGLAQLLRKPSPGIALNEHFVGNGDIVYQQACKLGCEGMCRSGWARSTAPG
jgi:bifunctional non-homologous end joining protein LigD